VESRVAARLCVCVDGGAAGWGNGKGDGGAAESADVEAAAGGQERGERHAAVAVSRGTGGSAVTSSPRAGDSTSRSPRSEGSGPQRVAWRCASVTGSQEAVR
jgi:hypothetical protein